MENIIISSEEMMTATPQENFYSANDDIDYERIREICKNSYFVQMNALQVFEGGYVSNLRLVPALKDYLGATDVFDDEVYLACFAPYTGTPFNSLGGFAITKFGICSFYFHANMCNRVHMSFEDLAKAKNIYEAMPNEHKSDTVMEFTYRAGYHWINADDKKFAFFINVAWYDNLPFIDLFRDIASSVRRDLGIGRVNIFQDTQNE